jgi:hypothetical protein
MEGFASDLQFRPEELTGILDEAFIRFQDENEDAEASWNYLASSLATVRASAFEFWVKLGLNAIREHPLRAYLHQDPISGRAFRKPRGYAGDARLLDLIYAHPDADELVSENPDPGKRLYAAAQKARSARAVRERRDILSSEIDRVCTRTPSAAILSVACGHLREAEICPAIMEGRFSKFVAVDQDKESLATIEARWKGNNIVPVTARLSRILKGGAKLGKFDLIYAAGIYDYLDVNVAREVTHCLFDLLNPGGELFIANFLPGGVDLAYMESVMDWWLIYRTLPEIEGTADGIPKSQVAARRLFEDGEKVIGYLSLTRT